MNRLTKYFLVVLLALTGIALVWMFVLAVTAGSREQFFANGGYDMFVPPNPDTGEKASQVMAFEPSRAVFHLFIVTVLGGAIIVNLLWFNGATRPLARWGCCGALALILYIEQWPASSSFLEYYSPAQVYHNDPAFNAVLQRLRVDTGRPRVAFLTRAGFYNTWLSLLFPYYDIDSIDIPAASRPPSDYVAFFSAVDRVPLRKWELCSVKYILGPEDAALQNFKQQGWDKDVAVTLELNTPFGKQALFECNRALPRAVVLHRWETIADPEKLLDQMAGPLFDVKMLETLNVPGKEKLLKVARVTGKSERLEAIGAARRELMANLKTTWNEQVLNRLTNPQFDPHTTLLLDADPGITADANAPSSTTVGIVEFKPMSVSLKTSLKSPGILMLNDRIDPGWSVTVDGAPARMLRANFIMRAVALSPGDHRVVFSYNGLAGLSLFTQAIWAAIAIGLVATGVNGLRRRT